MSEHTDAPTLESRLAVLEQRAPVDISEVIERLTALEQRTLPEAPAPTVPVDLAPVHDAIAAHHAALHEFFNILRRTAPDEVTHLRSLLQLDG